MSQITIRDLNELHRGFWEEQNALRDRRIADEAIRESAFARLSDEQARGISIYRQASIEKFLADAEGDKKRFLSQQGRRGGKAKQPDALQQEILKLVRRDPEITEAKLKDKLTKERFPGLIVEVVEEKICFVQPGRSKDERLKEAAISGLKDRLSRAKKTSNSR